MENYFVKTIGILRFTFKTEDDILVMGGAYIKENPMENCLNIDHIRKPAVRGLNEKMDKYFLISGLDYTKNDFINVKIHSFEEMEKLIKILKLSMNPLIQVQVIDLDKIKNYFSQTKE